VTDSTDFADYIDARRDGLVRAACLLVGDRGHAEDLVQSALIRVWPHWHRVSSRGDPEAYVRKVIFHQFASQARSRRWREVSADLRAGRWTERSDQAAPDATAALDTQLQLRDALAALGPRQRAVLVLRYYLDLSEGETAALLGCSVGTVKSQAARALARLKSLDVIDSDQLSHTRTEGEQP
jgi:RNA polymerase sigma-70 factor (sigma-E family)